ncbi:hypothetical protein KFK09_010585 [Dendrobium nobile]|uniref:MBD domain-containing protein n=1 Tax=Dendrobium nobile TaxID=94219 RepID=A0A8T3BDE3_DENNO|nr:hypothetical protein KFK09_010585 [Dendrobium nobile]
MKTRRLRETVSETPEDSPPEWLPNGWTVEVRNTRRGKYRCYRSPVSGCTFKSKEEVLHHLSGEKHGDDASRRASCSNESNKQHVEEMKESLEWLPSGWILEIKTRKSGKTTGKQYKCYFEPISGDRFYSKVEVLRFLSSRKFHEGTSDEKKHLDRNSTDKVIAHIEYSPDGLPHGWIKETKFSEANGSLTKNPSSASAKKLKSKPIGKKHHRTEEILSNGELSVTATFSDRLLLPPFSHENVEVKPEEQNAQESATLSPPCSLNPSERTPKNGRMPMTKCTRKSNISNEKTTVEIEENIKLEEVTKKPVDPLDQTVVDTQFDGKELAKHAEDEVNPGRGSKRESVSNSKENSKEEDKVMLQVENVTVKFPLTSNEKSKDLLGEEMELIMANQKASAKKEDFWDPRNKNLSELEKELPVVVGNPSTPDLVKPKHGSRKAKAVNAISSPRRFSRRLACVEADLAADVDMGGERPRESKSKNTRTEESPKMQKSMEGKATKTMECLQRKNTMENGAAAVMNQATSNWPDFPSTSPFGDSWLDPCLEFAFKTLTGDLPVLDDAIAIQEYFQQQLVSVTGSTNPDLHSPISNNKTVAAPASHEVEFKLPGEQHMQERYQLGAMENK